MIRHDAIAHRDAGFGLIEVLITLVIVAVGLLGAASLQLLSKRSNYDAAQRTTAAHLGQDLLERMRSNPAALINYMVAVPLGGGSLAAGPAVTCTAETVCSAEELAAYDLWQWERSLDGAMELQGGAAAGGLVAAQACVRGPAFGASGAYEVAIAWRGMTEVGDPASDDCGADSGNYGDGNLFRRVLVVRTFINAT